MKNPTPKKRDAALELNLTSMIDVIFLLLIFFVFTSDFKEPEKLLPTKLSGVGAIVDAPPVEQTERDLGKITARVAASPDGKIVWTIDGTRVNSLDAVETTFARLQEIDPNVPVVLAPERAVPIESVLDVYDRARRVGLSKIQFAADPETLSR